MLLLRGMSAVREGSRTTITPNWGEFASNEMQRRIPVRPGIRRAETFLGLDAEHASAICGCRYADMSITNIVDEAEIGPLAAARPWGGCQLLQVSRDFLLATIR